MHNFPIRFFLPSAMTFSNSGRLASRSFFLNEKFFIHLLGVEPESNGPSSDQNSLSAK